MDLFLFIQLEVLSGSQNEETLTKMRSSWDWKDLLYYFFPLSFFFIFSVQSTSPQEWSVLQHQHLCVLLNSWVLCCKNLSAWWHHSTWKGGKPPAGRELRSSPSCPPPHSGQEARDYLAALVCWPLRVPLDLLKRKGEMPVTCINFNTGLAGVSPATP